MDYQLKINQDTLPLEVETPSEDHFAITIGDSTHDVHYAMVHDHQIHLTMNGQRVNAYVSDQDDGKIIVIRGKTYFVQDADVLEQNASRKKGLAANPTEITPPMPAVVIAVSVKEGDIVEKGQGVVVVSAMKMETTLFAPFAGIVTRVNVAEGDKVMPGEILVDVEQAGQAGGDNAG